LLPVLVPALLLPALPAPLLLLASQQSFGCADEIKATVAIVDCIAATEGSRVVPSPLARSGCSCIVLILVDVAPATTAAAVFADAAALLLLLLLLLGKQVVAGARGRAATNFSRAAV
jgi:hypothetical protein